MDHIVDTPGRTDLTRMPGGTALHHQHPGIARAAGIRLVDLGDPSQGIVHVVSPEQGIALPGVTLVCPDSHTCTIGGLGALAWGIGSTEAAHALATKTLVVKKPKRMRIRFDGRLAPGVYAKKDMILHLISLYGAAGRAPAMPSSSAEKRSARCPSKAVSPSATWRSSSAPGRGVIAPDDRTFEYVKGRPFAPAGEDWEKALAVWRTLGSDADATFDREIVVDCSSLARR